jgi:hypothetical protein
MHPETLKFPRITINLEVDWLVLDAWQQRHCGREMLDRIQFQIELFPHLIDHIAEPSTDLPRR